MNDVDSDPVSGQGGKRARLAAALAAWTGAGMSAALVGGLVVWSWQLAVRDVSEVPVIQAAEGPMRIAPESPGGERAPHQGLTVNRVAENAEVEPPVQVALAPSAVDLAPEDFAPVAETSEAPEIADAAALPAEPPRILAPTDLAVAEALGLSSDAVLVLASAGAPDVKLPEVAKPRRAGPRPAPRPFVTAAGKPKGPHDLDAAALEPGTRLVQLGAFGSAEEARAAWMRLASRFGDYLSGKQRVVQPAETGGRPFWRLRAAGFADLSDARRFCSALNARQAECIPVVVR